MRCFARKEREEELGRGAQRNGSSIIEMLYRRVSRRARLVKETVVPICINNVLECGQTSVRSTEVGDDLAIVALYASQDELQRGVVPLPSFLPSFLRFFACVPRAMLLSFRLRRRREHFRLRQLQFNFNYGQKAGFPAIISSS